ncbi:hypothetical protein CLF_113326, partial [Clonorchis sinensis]
LKNADNNLDKLQFFRGTVTCCDRVYRIKEHKNRLEIIFPERYVISVISVDGLKRRLHVADRTNRILEKYNVFFSGLRGFRKEAIEVNTCSSDTSPGGIVGFEQHTITWFMCIFKPKILKYFTVFLVNTLQAAQNNGVP